MRLPGVALHLRFNPLDYYMRGWARDPQNSVQYQRGTEGKDNDSIYQFKEGDRQKGLQEIPKLFGVSGWS